VAFNPLELFLALMVGHAIADYPLQGDFLARAKNHRAPVAGVPWYQALTAHSLIHAGVVWLITGNIFCAFAEFFMHSFIDWMKCEGEIGFNTDQAMHAFCKATYAAFLYLMVAGGLIHGA